VLVGLDSDAPDRDDRASWPQLRRAIAERVRTRDLADWVEVFDGSDACVAPVLALSEAAAHPHLSARGTLVEVDGLVQPAPAPRFSNTPTALGAQPSETDADPEGVLAAWGIDDAGVLIESGVVAARPAAEEGSR
jgi:alpha-methylacyl-CoA racemase